MHRAFREQIGDLLQMRAVTPDRRAQGDYVFARRRRSLHSRGNGRHASPGLHYGEGFLGHRAADSLEHAIDIGNHLSKILLRIVDHLVGPEALHIIHIGGAGSRDDLGADVLGQFDGEPGDAARAALDQDGLAGFQFQGFLNGDDCRQANQRKGCRFYMGHSVRLSSDYRSLHRDLLSIGAFLAAVADAENGVTQAEIRHTVADRAHYARKVAPQHVGEVVDIAIGSARTHLPVRAVHAGRVNIHDHFAVGGDGIGQVAIGQDLGSAVPFDIGSFHESSPR